MTTSPAPPMPRPAHTRTLIASIVTLALLAPASALAAPSSAPATGFAGAGLTTTHAASTDIAAARASAFNTRFLTPRAGVRISTQRPTLRWRGLPGGATRVNVQVFRIDRGRATTVISVFSSGRSYRVPPGRLAPGSLYMWRVWAQRGSRGYTPRPVGVSFFSVASNAR